MGYAFLENIAIADAAFEATGRTLEELFGSAAEALEETQVDTSQLANSEWRIVKLKNSTPNGLLFDFLNELIFLKDAEQLAFGKFDIQIKTPSPNHYSELHGEEGSRRRRGSYTLVAKISGEKINPKKHELRADVKAVTKHLFGIKREGNGYKAVVVLDI